MQHTAEQHSPSINTVKNTNVPDLAKHLAAFDGFIKAMSGSSVGAGKNYNVSAFVAGINSSLNASVCLFSIDHL
jgi:hypothetical protein